MEQGSEEWLKWRRQGIGSSDAAAVMGESPWLSRFELWRDKKGLRPPQGSNYITERGHRLEPIARSRFELLTGKAFPPVELVHPEYEYLRASLDGLCEVGQKAILEIKVPGKEVYQMAKDGQVHPKYVWQLEHQLFVSGAEVAFFYVYYVNKREQFVGEATVEYESKPEKREKLLKELKEFWVNHIEGNVAPELDYNQDIEELDDQQSVLLGRELKAFMISKQELSEKLVRVDDKIDELKNELSERMRTKKATCLGVTITMVQSKSGNYIKATLPKEKVKDLNVSGPLSL